MSRAKKITSKVAPATAVANDPALRQMEELSRIGIATIKQDDPERGKAVSLSVTDIVRLNLDPRVKAAKASRTGSSTGGKRSGDSRQKAAERRRKQVGVLLRKYQKKDHPPRAIPKAIYADLKPKWSMSTIYSDLHEIAKKGLR